MSDERDSHRPSRPEDQQDRHVAHNRPSASVRGRTSRPGSPSVPQGAGHNEGRNERSEASRRNGRRSQSSQSQQDEVGDRRGHATTRVSHPATVATVATAGKAAGMSRHEPAGSIPVCYRLCALTALDVMRAGMIVRSVLDRRRVPGGPGMMKSMESPAIGRHSAMPGTKTQLDEHETEIRGHRA